MLDQLRGRETVLVVDDEPIVLSLARSILTRHGYHVLPAARGDEALLLYRRGSIDLLLTDVVMPSMSGPELAHEIKKENSGLRCIFMSGYEPDQIKSYGPNGVGCDYLRKPFTPEVLLRKVRETLDAPANAN